MNLYFGYYFWSLKVADVSSDGILRLDLDLEGAVLLNGIPCVDGTETKKPVSVAPSSKATETESGLSAEESTVAEQDVTQQKLPPISEDEPEKNEAPQKKVCLFNTRKIYAPSF